MTILDKYLDQKPGEYLSDEELVEVMADLALLARSSRRLGKCFASTEIAAAHTWCALSCMASARGLSYQPFA